MTDYWSEQDLYFTLLYFYIDVSHFRPYSDSESDDGIVFDDKSSFDDWSQSEVGVLYSQGDHLIFTQEARESVAMVLT